MDQLLAMRVFIRITDAGSFAKAADSLDLPRSSVSKLLQDLERHLGAKLIERNTRTLTVTPDGEAYREHALRLLADLEQMDQAVGTSWTSPRGILRVDIGSSLANLFLIPALPDFHRKYPGIEVQLGVSDRPVDIISEGVDCVIRGGVLPDSSLIARQLCVLDSITCASPRYLAEHGTPSHPSDIETSHVAVCYFFPQTGKSLPLVFSNSDVRHELKPRSAIRVSESTAHIQAVIAGLGVGQVFGFSARPHIADGSLVQVLPDWSQPHLPLHLVYPATRQPNAKLRAFSAWASELFGQVDGDGNQVLQ